MPFYDLRCPACDKEFNLSASMADKVGKRVPCPECGSFELETLYKTPPAFLKSKTSGDCPNRHVCGAGCRHAG
jgi:putative FmdB family regulatory protein